MSPMVMSFFLMKAFPFLKISPVDCPWVQFDAFARIFMIFIVRVKRSNQWTGIWSSAPANRFSSISTMDSHLTSGCTFAFPVLFTPVISIPIIRFVNFAVMFMGSCGLIIGPGLFSSVRILVTNVFWDLL